MESFYGGRQGASFIIVKAFDAIDSTIAGSEYKQKYYAVNENDIYIYEDGFIEKTAENFLNYIWKMTNLDGSEVETTDGLKELANLPASGMVQFFSKGGDTTSGVGSVNYGEYVIIDTFSKENPDNGKIYRRGMVLDNELAGAEYIGQIVGPRGKTPAIMIDHYKDIEDSGELYTKNDYTVSNEDLLPGTYRENNEQKFHDEIHYIYAEVKDSYGNIIGASIGFQIPYLMVDYEATSVKPYGTGNEDPTGPKRHGTNINNYYMDQLIIEDSTEFINGEWKHPFYQKWQMKIPHGYHGINSTNIEIIPTRTMPIGFKNSNYEGAPLWKNANLTQEYIKNGRQVILTDSYEIERDSSYIDGATSAKINHPTYGEVYVSREDCYGDVIRYRETNFDNLEQGEVTYFEIGDANFIKRLTLSKDGTLTAYYTSTLEPQDLEERIRWIDTIDSDGITIDDDGTIHIYYNTTHEENGIIVHDKQDYEKVLDWIKEISLSNEGEFKVEYNNDTVITDHDKETGEPIRGQVYTEQLQWIDKAELKTEIKEEINSSLNFYYCDDPDNPEAEYPVNFIIEALISDANLKEELGTDIPHSHLLVYYSDPDVRAAGPNVRYKSVKYPGWISDEWVDLGPVQGEPGGIHHIKEVRTLNELWDEEEQKWIPPEDLVNDLQCAGWSVTLANYTYIRTTTPDLDSFQIVANNVEPSATQVKLSTVEEVTGRDDFYVGEYVNKTYFGVVQILFYDYENKRWNSIGSIDSSTIDPTLVIVKSKANAEKLPNTGEASSLNVNGFWFGVETAYSAY